VIQWVKASSLTPSVTDPSSTPFSRAEARRIAMAQIALAWVLRTSRRHRTPVGATKQHYLAGGFSADLSAKELTMNPPHDEVSVSAPMTVASTGVNDGVPSLLARAV
jgi:hypothetical protein